MVAAYAVISVLVGILAVLLAGRLGWSGWALLLVYWVAGSIAVVTAGLVALVRSKGPTEGATEIDNADGSSEAATTPHLESPAARTPKREIAILAVDDDPFIRELIPMIAAQAGYRSVTTAASANDALDLIARSTRPFDCLLLDINMPGMDGIALCARLRTLAGYAHTPVIMLTALSDTAHLGAALRAGASDYITKPFDIAEFGRHLRIAETRLVARSFPIATAPVSDTHFSPVLGVPALVEPFALECYVSRLSGTDLTSAFVLALRTDERDDHAWPRKDWRGKQLQHLAYAIDDTLGGREYLMACLDSGAFIIVSHEPRAELVRTLEVQLEARISWALSRLSGAPDRVLIGSAIRLTGRKSNRASQAIDAALSSIPKHGALQRPGRS